MDLLAEPFTSLDDYLAWAERRPDEEQYEVVDGHPVMSPSPSAIHQLVLSNLAELIHRGLPADHRVLLAPLDWLLWESPRLQIRQPDLMVVRRAQIGDRLAGRPLLAVEVLSPTSVERDAVTKLRDYAKARLEHYWIVDPETPQLAVYRLRDDAFDRVTHGSGEAELVIDEPVALRLRPSDLLN